MGTSMAIHWVVQKAIKKAEKKVSTKVLQLVDYLDTSKVPLLVARLVDTRAVKLV